MTVPVVTNSNVAIDVSKELGITATTLYIFVNGDGSTQVAG